ncbi:lysine N(6)-hydroxylase/L-ornithine N(5)-oxygenase family protein [Chitinophaga nivalis]|uniref:SidA/IucD/PvdA family monooxygenase n=1 Tax=Chitinophaga nivalis TaxID=2991709 RepID=A0ABT3IKS2_9BACT|nr:SidA/IucD/PvdA family monooxygenase [Chitinophaga nivalis]MCW3465771.1 SidA/IucD/PvdA family monooxygenase [Chitinophaga nivalis]MCW3484538.1 SidA/IucD/PvdA family monooxygenase [Chitinophaga nivalis]
MKTPNVYHVIGIGIGPFNLGLAALLEPVKELSALFFDQAPQFNWHPGLMFSNATLQVPFMADLVTMADPTSPYSFLQFLKATGRIYKFYIREDFFILRKEYNVYCQWVAAQLASCRFSHQVTAIAYEADTQLYAVTVTNLRSQETAVYHAAKLVLGTGTQPHLPPFAQKGAFPQVIHGGDYLHHKSTILQQSSVTVIGSGQSAAEIFSDLLPYAEDQLSLNWYTRPDRFFPMEYSKLTLELTSPEYVDYFYNMPAEKRRATLAKQNPLFKGINYDLINSIFDTLYEMSVGNKPLQVQLRPGIQLDHISRAGEDAVTLHLTHVGQQHAFTADTGFVILATGYKYKEPAFLGGIQERIARDENGQYDVKRNYTIDNNGTDIFVQNAELHTHGFVTPDLGMGAYRNTCIINAIAAREVYHAEQQIAFQQFEADLDAPLQSTAGAVPVAAASLY